MRPARMDLHACILRQEVPSLFGAQLQFSEFCLRNPNPLGLGAAREVFATDLAEVRSCREDCCLIE